jgi:hypothetical protein
LRSYTFPREESDTLHYSGRALLAAGDRAHAEEKFDAAIAIYCSVGAGLQCYCNTTHPVTAAAHSRSDDSIRVVKSSPHTIVC